MRINVSTNDALEIILGLEKALKISQELETLLIWDLGE
jgi:hypothetical protein